MKKPVIIILNHIFDIGINQKLFEYINIIDLQEEKYG